MADTCQGGKLLCTHITHKTEFDHYTYGGMMTPPRILPFYMPTHFAGICHLKSGICHTKPCQAYALGGLSVGCMAYATGICLPLCDRCLVSGICHTPAEIPLEHMPVACSMAYAAMPNNGFQWHMPPTRHMPLTRHMSRLGRHMPMTYATHRPGICLPRGDMCLVSGICRSGGICH